MLDSTIKVDKLVNQCKEMGFKAVAITDHVSLSGHVKLYQECNKYGIKPIIGLEPYLCDDISIRDNNSRYDHLILLAKNNTGLKNLQILSSISWEKGFFYRPRLDYNLLKQYSEGLICTEACLGGIVKKNLTKITFCENAIKSLEVDDIEKKNMFNNHIKELKNNITLTIKKFINIFGKDNFYLEYQASNHPDQIPVNKKLKILAKHFGLKTIVTTDAHYLRPEDKELHGILLKSKPSNEREQEDFYDYTYIMTSDEIRQIMYPQIGKEETELAMKNTLDIADRVEEYEIKHDVLMPEIIIPEFKYQGIFKQYYDKYPDKYPYFNLFAESEDINDQYWLYLIEKGYIDKSIDLKPNANKYLEMINTELRVFELCKQSVKASYTKYHLTVLTIFDIIRACGSLISCGRGSVGAFVTCYLTNIVQIDAIEFNLPYWRYIHEDRPDFPDVDFDSEQGKKRIIGIKIKEYFGNDKVIDICTFGTISSKSAILAVSRAIGIPIKTAEKISSLIPVDRGKNRPLIDCLNGSEDEGWDVIPELKNYQKQYPKLFEYAIDLNGIIDKRSAHASGKLIFPDSYMLHNASMTTSGGQIVTQLNMGDSEYRGGIKYDFLITELQDKLHYCLNLLYKNEDSIHPDNINFKDKNLWKYIFHPGNTDEVFQWATEVGKNALKKLKPNNVKELSAGNSLIRLMNDDGEQLIDKYIRYKEDPDVAFEEMRKAGLNDDEIKLIDQCLREKYFICITQEDIMVLSREVAGFNIPFQHKLRKAIAKKKPELLKEVEQDFYEQGNKLNRRKLFLDYCWKMILALKGYGFSDIHADEYTIEGIKSAIFKYYHSLEWECACLNVNAGATDEEGEDNKSSKYGKLAKAIALFNQKGGTLRPPDINKADYGFTVHNNEIIFGLKPLNHIGDDAVKQIKENRPYSNLEDFYSKNCWKGSKTNPNHVNKRAVISLIKAGAFDFYNADRYATLMEFIELARTGKKDKRKMFDFEKHDYATLSKKDYAKAIEIYSDYNKYQWEFHAMNCYLSGTPFDNLYEDYKLKVHNVEELGNEREKEVLIFGSYMDKDDKPDKKYVYISTKTGMLKCRIKLGLWNEKKDLFNRGTALVIKGIYRYNALTIFGVKEYFKWFEEYKKKYEKKKIKNKYN